MTLFKRARAPSALVAVAFALCGQAAFAAPSLVFVNGTTTTALSVYYSPDIGYQAIGSVAVKKNNYVGGPFCVVFTLQSLAPSSSEPLTFGMYAPAATLSNQLSLSGSPTSPSQVLAGSFAATDPSRTTSTHDFAFKVFPSTMPPPGTYTATILESLYASTYLPSGSPYDTNTLIVTITVGSFYDLSVVPANNSFSLASTSQSLNFGTLSGGQALGANLFVRSNVPYSLSLMSANNGLLANTLDPASFVGYSLTANGNPVPLGPGSTPQFGGAKETFSSPMLYKMLATILPITDFPAAGDYSDTITITLSAP